MTPSAIVFCYDANRRVKTLEHSRFKAIWTVRNNGDTQIYSVYGKKEGKKKEFKERIVEHHMNRTGENYSLRGMALYASLDIFQHVKRT
jgi:hypothetical protein